MLIKQIASNRGAIALVDQIVYSATSFGVSVISGRTLGKEEFGLFSLGMTIILFWGSLGNSLIFSPYRIFCQGLQGTAQAQYRGSSITHQLSLCILCSFGLALVSLALRWKGGQNQLAELTWYLSLVSTFIMLREYARQLCFAHLDMQLALFLDLLQSVVMIGGITIFSYMGLLTTCRVFLIMGSACGISAAVWLLISYKTFVVSVPRAVSDLKKNLSFGKWLLFSGLAHTGSTQLYPWLINAFYTTAAVGVFSACRGTTAIIVPFLGGFDNFLGPSIAKAASSGGVRRLNVLVRKTSLLISVGMGIFCMSLIIFGDQLVQLMFGTIYGGNQTLITLLALSQFSTAVTFSVNHGLLALHKPEVHLKCAMVTLLSTATIGLWLVISFGTTGAAIGLLLGGTLGSLTGAGFYRKLSKDASKD